MNHVLIPRLLFAIFLSLPFINLFAANHIDNQVTRSQVLDLSSRSALANVEIEILNTAARIGYFSIF